MKGYWVYLLSFLLSIDGIAQYKTELYVAQDGSADYINIQSAIDDSKAFPDRKITIFVKSGVYEEKVKIHSWNSNITLKGENAATTIIKWGDYYGKIDRGRNSTFHTATLLVEGDNVRIENLTIENSAGDVGQAIALAVIGDRAKIKNCKLIGHQDTLYAAGTYSRQNYKACYIEGTTDFIFGEATVYFEDCVIHSKSDSYITAASTPEGRPYGFVFYACRLTADPAVTRVYLGRPWRDFAKTVFLSCDMGNHIVAEGWDNWSSPSREKTAYYAEYASKGAGANPDERVRWSHELSKNAAKRYSKKRVLKTIPVNPFQID